MKSQIIISIPLLLSAAAARPVNTNARLHRREVPQEHSHEAILDIVNTNLKLNNPDNIQDAVFGLLGNAAAAAGQGSISNTDCLQQATADQAFTNAKAANDVAGMTAALQYRALERNTGKVGLASVACTAIKATNPEVAAIAQHQDPASAGAAATNKAIALEVAKQINSIGGNPNDAIATGTFAPGNLNDATAKGNTCDDANDKAGCIVSQNLLQPDVSAADIAAAIGSAGAAPAAAASANVTAVAGNATAAAAACPAPAAAVASNATGAAAPAAAAGSSKLDLGTATNPTIVFGAGFDGRKEDSFEPADTTEFTHGSALNIKVVSDFICQQLGTKFKAAQATVDACNAGNTAAQAQTGQAAADTFNKALGF